VSAPHFPTPLLRAPTPPPSFPTWQVKVEGEASPTWLALSACAAGSVLAGIGGNLGRLRKRSLDDLDSYRMIAY